MLVTIIIVHSNGHAAFLSLNPLIMTFCMESISMHIICIPRLLLSTMTDGQSLNNITFVVRVLRKSIYTVSYLLHACSVFFDKCMCLTVIYHFLKPCAKALRY